MSPARVGSSPRIATVAFIAAAFLALSVSFQIYLAMADHGHAFWRLVAWQGVNPGLAALAGRRAGDRVRLLMSPDIAQSLVFGTSKHQLRSRTHVSGTTGYFDVTIEGVCEPQIWNLFGSLKIETSCKE